MIPRSPFTPLRAASQGLLTGTPRSLVETDDPEVRALVRARGAGADVAVGLQLNAARYLDEVPLSRACSKKPSHARSRRCRRTPPARGGGSAPG